MTTTGRANLFDKLEDNPSKPFLKDLENDLIKIDKYFNAYTSKRIKKEMIEAILKSI